ncbi:hypothetical protein OB13_17505 [Pontibacter sp. HJ8]
MSINNMSDEELDNLFRRSAEGYDPPYDPEDWKAMEKKLELAEGGPAVWQKYLYPLLILLMIGTGITVSLLKPEPASIPEQAVTATTESPQVQEQEPRSQSATASAKLRLGGKQPFSPGEKKSRSPLAGMAKESALESDRQQVSPPAAWSTSPEMRTAIPVQEVEKLNTSAVVVRTLTLDTLLLMTSVPEAPKPQADSSYRPNPERVRKSTFGSSLQLTLAVAPDVTTVRFSDPEGISQNAGLLVGIPLAGRLSLVTGALWAHKVYQAYPDNYRPTPDFWDGKKLPSSIDAECRVLDVPLNLSFRLLGNEKNTVALLAGVSSYFMLKEKYRYNYTYSAEPYSRTSRFSNENRHWFGVQNVSVSYSRKLSPVFSVGVEPFVKFPLSGIGAGQVKLTSAGVFFTAGYTIRLKQ